MGRPPSRIRTPGLRAPSEAPWKATFVPRPARDETVSSTPETLNSTPETPGSTPEILSAETDLDVLMAALLGSSAAIRGTRDRRVPDVESRLAEVLADVGLLSMDKAVSSESAVAAVGAATEESEGVPAQTQTASSLDGSPAVAGSLAFAQSRPSAGLGRWLWLAVPVLLAVAIVSSWLAGARSTDKQPSTAGRAALPKTR